MIVCLPIYIYIVWIDNDSFAMGFFIRRIGRSVCPAKARQYVMTLPIRNPTPTRTEPCSVGLVRHSHATTPTPPDRHDTYGAYDAKSTKLRSVRGHSQPRFSFPSFSCRNLAPDKTYTCTHEREKPLYPLAVTLSQGCAVIHFGEGGGEELTTS